MPEYPDKKTETKSTSNYSVSFGGGIPLVRSISGYFLQKEGWSFKQGTTYVKGDNEVTFDGVHWKLNGITRVEFMHELKQK